MPDSVIRSYLLRDVVDSTPAAIRALPGNSGRWDNDSEVPVYMYTSLCTLWTGVSGDVVNFDRLVQAEAGQATVTANSIVICPLISESSTDPEGPEQIDYLGGENAKILITFQQDRQVPEELYGRVENSELRVRLLIDANLRGLSRKPQYLPVVGDKSIDKNAGFYCIWTAYSNDPHESYLVSEYNISYIRSLGQAIIP